MILVTGATGNVGSALVKQLAMAGEPVRGLSRGGDASRLPPGAEAAAGDLNSPESLIPALTGVRAGEPRTFRQWAQANAGAFA
ncbi:NAD(P)H-binding protein [Streptomyces sp. ISL-1]|uniref:SDR family oxidoreductase n=1 Tax=Streptomyces sp. ISL-1 TaxID=2817657 RepID=UPI001BE9DCCE|nr:NAD(P)H-binding protein [Streptomyces sp. ISL-1]MBT2392242.1 NAD(P)H-binding protein [Streptomyces sp. ISL-1]